jgi:hypothetical protein
LVWMDIIEAPYGVGLGGLTRYGGHLAAVQPCWPIIVAMLYAAASVPSGMFSVALQAATGGLEKWLVGGSGGLGGESGFVG